MKRYLVLILAVITLLSLNTLVLGESSNISKFIDKANEQAAKFEAKVEASQEKDILKIEDEVAKSNELILSFIQKEIDSNNLDLDKLVQKTNDIAFQTIEKAAKCGIEVICEYEAYEIQGNIVYIDPLKVVRR